MDGNKSIKHEKKKKKKQRRNSKMMWHNPKYIKNYTSSLYIIVVNKLYIKWDGNHPKNTHLEL